MDLILDFESDGFTNVDIKHEQDTLTLNTNVTTKEEFKQWLEVLGNKNKQCFNVYKSYPVGERKVFNQKYICLHGIKHKGVKKTSTGCRVFLHVVIKMVHKRSPEHIRQFPCSVEIQGHHNHPLEVAESLNQLKVSTTTKEMFVKYFEQGMTPTQAHRHHVLKMDLCNDLYGQADHTINPSRRSIQYMWEVWRKQEHGGLNTISMFEAIEKYAQANPDIIVKVEHSGNSFCIVLITPFMMRAHKELKEAAEVVFVDATGCVDQLNTAVIPFLCAGPAGAVPLALMFTSSQAEATLTKGFGMVKEALGDSAFYGKGNPQCFITDNCEAERKALATTWPTTMLFLCIFHILQQVWRWLLDAKHGIHKEHRKELMHMMKSLVYATSRDEFSALWNEVETSPLLEQYSNFRSYLTILVQRREEWAIAFRAGVMLRGHHINNFAESTICIIKDVVLNRCKAYNTAQLLVFMVEIFDCYMRQRLVDVALCRQQAKSISSEKTAHYVVKSTGEGLYTVQSQSDQLQCYYVDLTIGMCTCVQGQNGAICKHQIACADYGMTVVPQIFVSTSRNRQWLAALAVGEEHVPKMSFFKGLTEVTENETNKSTESDVVVKINAGQMENVNTESFPEDITDDDYDLTADSTIVAQALTEKTVELGDTDTRVALQRFLQRVQSLKTTNQLNTFLNSAGSVSVRHGGAGRGKIPCQPTSIARRPTGMPRGAAPIGKGRRPAAALSSKPKRPRSLAYNVERNVANAKSHGSGHYPVSVTATVSLYLWLTLDNFT